MISKTEPATLTALTIASRLGEKYLKQIHFDIEQDTGQNPEGEGDTTNPTTKDELNPNLIFKKGYNDGVEKGKKRLLEEFQKKGLDLSSEENIEKITQLLKAQEDLETEKLMKKQDFDTLIQKTTSRFEAQLKQKEEKIAKYESQIYKVAVENALIAEATRLNAVNPKQAARLLLDEYKFEVDYETLSVTLLGKDGNTVTSKKTGNDLSILEATELFFAENSHLVKPDNLIGSGARGTGNTPAKTSSNSLADINAEIGAALETVFKK